MAEPRYVPSTLIKPTLIALHFLGGSAAQWNPVFALLADRFELRALDLPGFGAAAQTPGYDVAAMAAHVATEVRRLAPKAWLLVGHSMGAKVACAVARMAEDGAEGLGGLTHLVLLAGSPPAPEPMGEHKRRTMRRWFTGAEAERRREADGYIRDNVARKLPDERHAGLVEAVLGANRNAWIAWLDGGSREDWAPRIATLRTPTLIIAGDRDAALGPNTQRALMAPHFAAVRLHVLHGAAHLLPSEQPEAVATCLCKFAGAAPKPLEPAIPPTYRALIDSPRVSARTREVLLDRAKPVGDAAGELSDDDLKVLQALADRIIPQPGQHRIDIASRMIAMTSQPEGDGWRFAELPPDLPLFRAGLRNLDAIAQTIDAAGFAFLPAYQQDALLTALVEARLRSPLMPEAGGLTPRQLQLWFEDMRSCATQVYVSHPVTAARIGFGGIANRGDGAGPQGFPAVGLGQREAWEPVAKGGNS